MKNGILLLRIIKAISGVVFLLLGAATQVSEFFPTLLYMKTSDVFEALLLMIVCIIIFMACDYTIRKISNRNSTD